MRGLWFGLVLSLGQLIISGHMTHLPPKICVRAAISNRQSATMGPPPCVTTSDHSLEAPGKAFSELTLFLFGSGLALFIALLGWSDQIRGINRDTRDLETRFLQTTGIQKADYLSIVKPTSPEERLAAITEIMASGKPKTVAHVEVLKIFTEWHGAWTKLEALSVWKYRLAVILTWTLLLAGTVSLGTYPGSAISVSLFRIRIDFLILAAPVILVMAILVIMSIANHRESHFLELLSSLTERV